MANGDIITLGGLLAVGVGVGYLLKDQIEDILEPGAWTEEEEGEMI